MTAAEITHLVKPATMTAAEITHLVKPSSNDRLQDEVRKHLERDLVNLSEALKDASAYTRVASSDDMLLLVKQIEQRLNAFRTNVKVTAALGLQRKQ